MYDWCLPPEPVSHISLNIHFLPMQVAICCGGGACSAIKPTQSLYEGRQTEKVPLRLFFSYTAPSGEHSARGSEVAEVPEAVRIKAKPAKARVEKMERPVEIATMMNSVLYERW